MFFTGTSNFACSKCWTLRAGERDTQAKRWTSYERRENNICLTVGRERNRRL